MVCRRCRGSGLLVPARDLGSLDAALVADEAGAAWLDWLGYVGDGLVWPLPWAWTLSGRRFPIRHACYPSDADAVAWMQNRNVIIGLFRIMPGSRRHLEQVYRMACGEDVAVPVFVMPRKTR